MNTAARYIGNGALEVVETEAGPPAAGEVSLDVAYTGICGTDLHIVHGAMDARVALPAVLGHEMAGHGRRDRRRRRRLGRRRRRHGHAARLVRHCPACRAARRTSATGWSSSASTRRLDAVALDRAGGVHVRLPADLTLQAAALAEPTAVAVHDVRRSGLARRRARRRRRRRADRAPDRARRALRRRRRRCLRAECARADWPSSRSGFAAVDPLADDAAAWVDDWTDGAGADVVFEVSGTAGGIATAVDRLGARGRAVVVGSTRRRRRSPLPRLLAGADADRRARVRAGRLRGGGRLLATGHPGADADHGRRAARRRERGVRELWTRASR